MPMESLWRIVRSNSRIWGSARSNDPLSAQDPARFANCSGEHAEERLVESKVWTDDIPSALDSRSALEKLQFNFARRFENTVFCLASLGYYQSSKFMSPEHDQRHPSSNKPRWVTTQQGLERLTSSGWRLTTLSFDGMLTSRGQELSDFLAK